MNLSEKERDYIQSIVDKDAVLEKPYPEGFRGLQFLNRKLEPVEIEYTSKSISTNIIQKLIDKGVLIPSDIAPDTYEIEQNFVEQFTAPAFQEIDLEQGKITILNRVTAISAMEKLKETCFEKKVSLINEEPDLVEFLSNFNFYKQGYIQEAENIFIDVFNQDKLIFIKN